MSKEKKDKIPFQQRVVKFLVVTPFVVVGVVVVLLCLIRNGSIAKEMLPSFIQNTISSNETLNQINETDNEAVGQMIDDLNENHSVDDWSTSIEDMLTNFLQAPE